MGQMQKNMSFKASDSIDELIENCKRESEAVQLPPEHETAVATATLPEERSAAPSAQAEEKLTSDTIDDKKNDVEDMTGADVQAAEEPASAQQEIPIVKPKKKKPVPAYGKNGRALKTDPYGNPIRKRKKDAPLRSETPVDTVTPADIRKPQVSFMNSVATLEPASRSRWTGATSQAYDHAVLRDDAAAVEGQSRYSPKIRRMRDSTRAKELADKKRKRTKQPMPYEKDSPAVTSTAARRRKGKSAMKGQQSDRIPEALMEQPYEESAPIQYMEKAAQTSIDLSAPEESGSREIDIDVHYHEERRLRMDLPKREKRYRRKEDGKSIRSDIAELQITLTLRLMFLGLATLCSAVIAVLDQIPVITPPTFLSVTASPISVLLIQILLGMLAIAFSGELIKNGFVKLLHLRADCDSLAAISLVSAELAAVLAVACPTMLQNRVISIYIATALFTVWLNTISRRMIVSRAQRNFAVLTDGNPKYSVHYVEDESRAENLTRGTGGEFPIMATMRPTEQINDFLRYTFSSDLGDRFCRFAVPVLFGISAVLAIFLSVIRADNLESPLCYGVSVFALCFSAAACAAIPLVSNLPMDTGTKRYVRNNGLLLGYQSVDDFYDVNTVMVDITTLFPQGTSKLESIQVIGESHLEDALRYGAALTKHAGSVMKDIFAAAIVTEQQELPVVENYAYEEGKGISGWIDNKRVLMGTRELMAEHNISALPPYAKELELTGKGSEAIYLSVSGTAAALFIIQLSMSRSIKRWLHELERERICLLIRSNDALLPQRRIAKMFGFPEQLMKVIPSRLEADFEAETQPVASASPSMICAGRLPGFIQTIVGAKRIRRAATLGIILQAAAATLGLLYAIVFLLIGAHEDLSGGVLLLYQLVTALITISAVHLREL